MKDRAPETLAAVAVLLVSAAALLCLHGAGTTVEASASEEFQRLTGGFGGGAAVLPVPCESGLDTATSEHCTMLTSPAAGGIAWCPVHAGPSLRR